MIPIPNIAKPIATMIAAAVPRPDCLPTCPPAGHDALRWEITVGFRDCIGSLFCPLGLMPGEMYSSPPKWVGTAHAPQRAFIEWWDNLPEKDAAEAVNAIWGPE